MPTARSGLPEGPLANSYPAAVLLVVFSLVPYLVLSAAVLELSQEIGKSLHIPPSTMDVTVALSTAAYSAGTVLAVQFAVHLPARRMLVLYETLFVIASVLAAAAPDGPVFIGAFVVQGLCTSLVLIAAVPPLVTAWPAKKMPYTGAVMNLCIFGAVAVGPTLGALLLDAKDWRPLFWAVAGVAVAALIVSLLTFQDDPQQDESAPWDLVAIGMVLVGTAAAFFGAGQLQAGNTPSAEAIGPLAGGFALLVLMIAYEYRIKHPLMPIKGANSTVPVTGILIALTSSAAAFGIMVVLITQLQKLTSPLHAALYFLPEFGAAVLTAVVFGALFRTRFTPVLALGGLLAVVASAALLLVGQPGNAAVDATSTGLLGLGVGASVSPALFMAGLSMQSQMLPRVFAMIELMRGVTAFMLAPIFAFLAVNIGSTAKVGATDTIWICLVIAGFGFVAGAALYVSGRPWLEVPDLERWQGTPDSPAWTSPALLGALKLSRAAHAGRGRPMAPSPGSPPTPHRPPQPTAFPVVERAGARRRMPGPR